jgi:5-methyltetrahydrofolate--homocysteine methyltransferase
MIGTVQGDIHDIGKNLVGMLLDGAGFEVFDLGVDVSADKFVAAIEEKKPHIVGISALLSTTMLEMSNVIEAIKAAGLRDQVKILVGGAPVTAEFSKKIGADGFAPEAGSAVEVAKQFMTQIKV